MQKRKWVILTGIVLTALMIPSLKTEAAPLQSNTNVSWTTDKEAFTTDAGEAYYTAYPRGTTVYPGGESTLSELEEGQHKYSGKEMTEGNVPIEKWVVAYTPGECVHADPDRDTLFNHGISFGTTSCGSYYKPGWFGYCAECHDRINMLFYMDEETALSISELPIRKEYYYKCPVCDNLEQAAPIMHECNGISWNQYTIVYDSNGKGVNGFMPKSTFMYNNETVYKGKAITPETKLRKCSFVREGYEFTEWNTKADGSGQSFADEAEIYNLTTENEAEIVLYAQWEKCESELYVDANGGKFNGQYSTTYVKQGYGTTYQVSEELVTPPAGATISFETNGGTEVSDIEVECYFLYWQISNPFYGTLLDGIYTFGNVNNASDYLTAQYGSLPIILPDCSKAGAEFGGWYKDEECTVPVGKAGDEVVLTEDTILYAQWVSLQLNAMEDYMVLGGSGAVDLSWIQNDSYIKTYRLYQSLDNLTWTPLSFAGNGGVVSVEEDFVSTGTEKTYTVPYSGLYTITASGAQGEDYDTHVGGKGGRVSATVWLSKGEILTYKIGTTDGYNGGGTGEPYGNGGGMTSVSSDLKGLLLIAGGGGGASSHHDGGAGGTSQSLVDDSNEGGSGGAGGGGGYKGGTAGEAIIHNHIEDCYAVVENNANESFYSVTGLITEGIGAYNGAIAYGDNYVNIGTHTASTSTKLTLTTDGFAVLPYEGTLSFTVSNEDLDESGDIFDCYRGDFYDTIYQVTVYDKDTGEVIYEIDDDDIGYTSVTEYDVKCSVSTCTYHRQTVITSTYTSEVFTATRIQKLPIDSFQDHNGAWTGYDGEERITFDFHIPIEKDITNVYVKVYTEIKDTSSSGTWCGIKICDLSYVCDVQTCGYTDGQVLSAYPSYGGSNYVNETYCTVKTSVSGEKEGDGALQIQLSAVEYIDNLEYQDAEAPDLAAPDRVDEDSVIKTSISGNTVRIVWDKPVDYGTDYYHKAESYNALSGQKLCDSNITLNHLISGIRGYYYVIDTIENTVVSKLNGSLTESNSLTIAMTADVQYLHLAATDRAGNLSETIHIQIGKKDPEVAWKISTEQISIEGTDSNIYASDQEKTWFVRADGSTPFILQFNAGLETVALSDYQINYMNFETVVDGTGKSQSFQTYTPSHALQEGTFVSGIGELTKSMAGELLLEDAAYTVTTRSNSCSELSIQQHFLLSVEFDEQILSIVPVAGAKQNDSVAYSDWPEDQQNGIRIIGDGTAPEVQGTELLEDMAAIDWNADSILLDLSCSDNGSGVKDFYVVIDNQDNYISKTFRADATGHIKMDLADETDYTFVGDFILTIHAVDNVGNDSQLVYSTERFSLSASVERMRAPHEPLMKRGDTGILHITTSGYVDKIEIEILDPIFPEKIVFEYDSPEYLQEEDVEFFVPLDAPEGTYQIVVNAYKNGNKLNAEPVLGVFELSGTVLDEFRRKINWNF